MMSVRVTRAAVFIAVAAYGVSLFPGVRENPGFSAFWDVGINVLVLLGAATVCCLRAVTSRVDRAGWACIGIGLASYATGTLVYYSFIQHLDDIPYPSISDGLWMLLYPLAILGIGLMVRARMAGSVASMWLDGVVSGLGLISLSASFVFPRITHDASGEPAAIITNFAYPFLDLALLATVVGAMAAIGAWREKPWILLGAGFFVFAVADSVYLLQLANETYHPGSLVDAAYLVAALLVATAASFSPDLTLDATADPASNTASNTASNAASNAASGAAALRVPIRAESRSFLVPGVFTLTAISVLVVGAWTDISTLGIVLAVGALLAAWARIALAIREVVGLSDSRRQARTDALTGLPNRRAFYELLEQAEDAANTSSDMASSRNIAAVILVDLDRFKEINDALGHEVGDRVLCAVSQRFATLVPIGGTIARLGGDEIAMLVPGMATTDAVRLAQRILRTLEEPFIIQDTSLHIDASIGVTGIDAETGASRALAKADLSMYRAKNSRTGWEVYDDERDGNAWDRLATVEALRDALADGGLEVEFQPIVSTSTSEPVGVEALVRWNHPVRGRVAPDAFLPLAEGAGLMPALTRKVLNLSLDEAVLLGKQGQSISVSVNLSASDLLDTQLVDFVADALARRGLTGAALRIEITESLLVEGTSSTDFLLRLRGLGIRLAVDDYGTGFSSLAYLHDLPVSYLKIDRVFTGRMLEDKRTAVIVASTIDMAHRLKLEVVAEGVETAAQLEWLQAHGCDLLQGYHLGRPMTVDGLHRWLTDRPTPVIEQESTGSLR